MPNIKLERGKRYRVFYRIRGVHRTVQEFTALYIGDTAYPELPQFSLRPLAGSLWLNWRDILHAERVVDHAPVMLPYKSDRQDW